MHEDDTLPRKLTQCLEAFVGFQESSRSTKAQTVKLMSCNDSEPRKEKDALHIILASAIHNQSDLPLCNSVHTRAEVLWLHKIEAGIVPLRRFTRQEVMSQTCQSLHASTSHVVTRIPRFAKSFRETLSQRRSIMSKLQCLSFVFGC